MRTLRWVACITVLGACGGTAAEAPASKLPSERVEELERSSGPVHKRGGEKLIAEVGREGGVFELDNGARLEIPEGALEEPVQVTFAAGNRTTAFSNREYERPLGPTLEIGPELSVTAPLRVSVPLTALPEGFSDTDLALGLELLSDAQRGVEMQGVQTRWDYLPASSQSGRAVAELGQVPGYRLQFVLSKSE